MSLTLGRDPETLQVRLAPGSDWWTTLHRRDGDWPAGATIELHFAVGIIWPALITGADATFSHTADQVAAVLANGRQQQVDLRYNDGAHALLWARGRVATHG